MHTSLSIGLIASAALTAVAGVQQNSSSAAYPGESHLILDWNRFAQQVIAADNGYQNPLPATRALAMMHLAVHDAINAAAPRYATYAIRTRDQQADPTVAAAQAAHDVLAAIYPGQKPALHSYLEQYLGDAGVGSRVAKGVALGKRAAADIIGARADDRSAAEQRYKEGGAPGEYRFVPGFDFVNMPHWRSVKPFALGSPAQFRVNAPPALASKEYARAFDEVKRKGERTSEARTPDESHYAAFWYELSDIGWNRIARVVWREHPQDLWTTARTFALLNAALADSYIAGWDSKMHYNFWRPISAIRLAVDDGNRATARENAESRIMAGIHFRFAIDAGLALGQDIGRYTVKTLLGPTPAVSDSPND